MPGTPTTHYQLPTYAPSDPPDLEGAYNEAMVKIDAQMEVNEQMATDAVAEAAAKEKSQANATSIEALAARVTALEEGGSGGGFAPSDTDAILDVAKAAQVKVTSDGIVYWKGQS